MKTTATTIVCHCRKIRCLLLPALMAAVVLFTSAAGLHAATIGVNFAPTASGHTLPSGTSAGVVPQTNWQNVTTTSITGLTLFDNSGLATSAALTVTGASLGLGWLNSGAVVGDEWLNDTNISASGGTLTFTVTSIPYASYDLIIYDLPLFSNVKYTYTVGSTSYFGNSPAAGTTSAGYVDGNSGTAFNYGQATSTNTASPTPNSTYARFDGLSGSSLTFTVTGANGIAYTNGFQIIEAVPEPSRVVLLMSGLVAFALRRSRRRA